MFIPLSRDHTQTTDSIAEGWQFFGYLDPLSAEFSFDLVDAFVPGRVSSCACFGGALSLATTLEIPGVEVSGVGEGGGEDDRLVPR